jgi:hypothetical protein
MDRAGTPPGLRVLHWFNDPRRREQAINVVLWRCLSAGTQPAPVRGSTDGHENPRTR